jgi:uncharacterized protein (DUF736 family)
LTRSAGRVVGKLQDPNLANVSTPRARPIATPIGLISAKTAFGSNAFEATATANFFPLAAEDGSPFLARRQKSSPRAVLRLRCGSSTASAFVFAFSIAIEAACGGPTKRRHIMATIGTFSKTGDGFTGSVSTLTLDANVQVKPAEKMSEKAPDFRIFAGRAEIGAAWRKTSNENRSYLSVRLDDPSLAAPILANLCEMENGEYDLIWSRPNRRRTGE